VKTPFVPGSCLLCVREQPGSHGSASPNKARDRNGLRCRVGLSETLQYQLVTMPFNDSDSHTDTSFRAHFCNIINLRIED
jgi:hypothetical protein